MVDQPFALATGRTNVIMRRVACRPESTSSVFFFEVRLNGTREKLKVVERRESETLSRRQVRSDLTCEKVALSGVRPQSCYGTAVSYDGCTRQVRHYFTWILSLTKEKRKWKDIIVHTCGLAFKIESASRTPRESEYEDFVSKSLILGAAFWAGLS